MNTRFPAPDLQTLRSVKLPLRGGADAVVQACIGCLRSELLNEPVEAALGTQHRALAPLISRSATTPLTSAGSTLLGLGVVEFLAALGAQTAGSALLNAGLKLSFAPGTASIHVPGYKADSSSTFIAEGAVIPVRMLDVAGGGTLYSNKLPLIVACSRELFANPNVEAVVKSLLSESISQALDNTMFSSVPADGTVPGGLRAGIPALTASANTDPLQAMTIDITTLVKAVAGVAGNGPIAIVASPGESAALKIWARGTLDFPIFATSALSSGVVMAVATAPLVSAFSPAPRFSVSDQAVLHFDSTSPADLTTASVGTTVKSMWQSGNIAVRVILEGSLGMRASGGVSWLTTTIW
jgi:hypothetical protein